LNGPERVEQMVVQQQPQMMGEPERRTPDLTGLEAWFNPYEIQVDIAFENSGGLEFFDDYDPDPRGWYFEGFVTVNELGRYGCLFASVSADSVRVVRFNPWLIYHAPLELEKTHARFFIRREWLESPEMPPAFVDVNLGWAGTGGGPVEPTLLTAARRYPGRGQRDAETTDRGPVAHRNE